MASIEQCEQFDKLTCDAAHIGASHAGLAVDHPAIDLRLAQQLGATTQFSLRGLSHSHMAMRAAV